MSSTDDLLRELEADESFSSPSTEESSPPSSKETDTRRARASRRVRQAFSPRYFVIALALVSVALFVFGTFVPFVPGSGLVGVFLATFVLGGLSSERRYLETGVAGALAAGAGMLSDFLVLAFLGRFELVVIVGAVLGAFVALLGFYFGRDFRTGLTREIE